MRPASEKLGIGYRYAAYAPCYLPSPHYPPLAQHAQPSRPDAAGNRQLWELEAQGFQKMFGEPVNAHRASVGLPAVDNLRDYVFTSHPGLAARPGARPLPGGGRPHGDADWRVDPAGRTTAP
jgi:vancomycin aglycone glucosyltransferase